MRFEEMDVYQQRDWALSQLFAAQTTIRQMENEKKSRSHKSWQSWEDKILTKGLADDKRLEEIATELHRSVGACRWRLARKGYSMSSSRDVLGMDDKRIWSEAMRRKLYDAGVTQKALADALKCSSGYVGAILRRDGKYTITRSQIVKVERAFAVAARQAIFVG